MYIVLSILYTKRSLKAIDFNRKYRFLTNEIKELSIFWPVIETSERHDEIDIGNNTEQSHDVLHASREHDVKSNVFCAY